MSGRARLKNRGPGRTVGCDERIATVLLALGALILSACSQPQPDPEPEPKPAALASLLPAHPNANVIVLSFDALRADALGTYGYRLETSPHIDAFSGGAMHFVNAYSVAPKTPTSFASAFTGQYPNTAFNDWRLRSESTLAEEFQKAGYRTAAFLNNPHLPRVRGFARGFETYRYYPGMADEPVLREAGSWLRRNAGEKLFVWVHLFDPHAPYDRRTAAEHLYDPAYQGRFRARAADMAPVADEKDLEHVRSLYDGEVHAADQLFGEWIALLKELELYDTSFVILTSDHGEEFMEHGHMEHGRLNEENLRIPLLIRAPGQQEGHRFAGRVSNLDLLPTVLPLVGVPAPTALAGRNLRDSDPTGRALIAVANTDFEGLAASILSGREKLIVQCFAGGERQLFDLVEDPGETRNLAKERTARADALEVELWRTLGLPGCSDLPLVVPGRQENETKGLPRKSIEALKRLGYIEE